MRLQFKDNVIDQTWNDVAPEVTASASAAAMTDLPGKAARRLNRGLP
jgi:hypothetical protein